MISAYDIPRKWTRVAVKGPHMSDRWRYSLTDRQPTLEIATLRRNGRITTAQVMQPDRSTWLLAMRLSP